MTIPADTPDTTIDRTDLYDEVRRARAYVRRYREHPPVKAETRARLREARDFIKAHPDLETLPASIPSGEPIRGYDGRRVYRALAAILDDPRKRDHGRHKVQHETYLEREHVGAPIDLRYHATDIVTVDPDGRVTLRHNGWTTKTTQERINNFLCDYVRGVGGFPHDISVGAPYAADCLLPDHGRSAWYVTVADPAGRSIRREPRYWPPRTYTKRGGYRFDPETHRCEWNPEYEHEVTERGSLRDYRVVERAGTYLYYPFPRDHFTIGPHGRIKPWAEYLREREALRKREHARRLEAEKAAQAELARKAALPDDELADESGWTIVPADEPLYKVLLADPDARETDPNVAGRAPYQTDFVWRIGQEYRVDGVLEPCRNALHACTRAQLPQWYQDVTHDDRNGNVVYTFLPTGRAYSAAGKCFARAARLGRRLTSPEILALLKPAPTSIDSEV